MCKIYLKDKVEIKENSALPFNYRYWVIRDNFINKKGKLQSTFYHTKDFVPDLFYKHITRSI